MKRDAESYMEIMKYNLNMLNAPISVRLEGVVRILSPEFESSISARDFFEEEALLNLLSR